ncbi:MAG: phosphate--AMP phosphotransferase [Solirubrobacterales bacterium]
MIIEYDFENISNPYKHLNVSELGDQLGAIQRQVKNLNIPVLIIVDGWESSGKGFIIKELIRGLDPRSFKVSDFENCSEEEKTRPFLWRFWKKLPKRGDVSIFDRSFYYKAMNHLEVRTDELKQNLEDFISMEKKLFDDDMIIIKFFLHEREKTQRKRIDELKNDKFRSFFVTHRDIVQNSNYKAYLKHFDAVLKLSDLPFSSWNVVNTEDLEAASKFVLGTTIQKINSEINRINEKSKKIPEFETDDKIETKPLDLVDLSMSLGENEYKEMVKKLQEEVKNISYELYNKKIPCVLVFEGMDAAGKGGTIKRLTRAIDPRIYEVVPIAAPDETEKKFHYLWRFMKNIPPKGRITIFDRSWYGRVLVERIEGFASVPEWKRSYEEINNMERQLANFGTLVLKFFLYIDKDEQLRRFNDREANEKKLYKITSEDWRNREKWDGYIDAMNEMLVRTNTAYAPWIIISGQDKKYARVKVMQEFIKYGKQIIGK